MAEHLAEATETGDDDLADILCAVANQRARLEEFSAQQREKIQSFSTTLQERLEAVRSQLAQKQEKVNQSELALGQLREEVESRQVQVEQLESSAAERESELKARDEATQAAAREVDERQDELLKRAAEVDDEVAQVAEERKELDNQKQVLSEEIQQLTERREHLQEKLEQIDREREDISNAHARTEEQRRRLAERFQAKRNELIEQRSQLVANGEADSEQLDALKSELRNAQHRGEELEAEVDSLRNQCKKLESRAPGGKTSAEDAEKIEQLGQACRELERRSNADKKRIAELEQDLEQSRESGGAGEGGSDEYRERYEMAMSDLREQRNRINELEVKLEQAKSSGGGGFAAADNDAMDWEAQKRRLLASLESDFDEADEEQQQEKLKLEEAIRMTEQVVAGKDRELDQLQQLLEEQSSNVGNMAVGAAAVADLLDKDELILQERENLRHIQEEWRDKLRQSEIDISLERAKLARDKAQLEERLREFESEMEQNQKDGSSTDDKKKSRGNWLSRMGLRGDG